MGKLPFSQPRPLVASDPVAAFACRMEALNHYLKKYAFQAQAGNGARTYVSLSGAEIAGYYTLAYGSIEYEKAPSRVIQGLARHPVPVMLLARLAVDEKFSGQGLGKELLRDAFLKTLAAADIAGLRSIIVDAKDDEAKRFYEKFGFEAFPDTPLRLSMILKDVRAQLRS